MKSVELFLEAFEGKPFGPKRPITCIFRFYKKPPLAKGFVRPIGALEAFGMASGNSFKTATIALECRQCLRKSKSLQTSECLRPHVALLRILQILL